MDVAKLTEWNPWWEDVSSLKEFEGVSRPQYTELVGSVEVKEVTIITGVRRCGKSTLMYQMIRKLLEKGVTPKQILFVNFEDKKLEGDDIETIYASYKENMNPDKKTYVFFDEIHKKTGWESWIRRKYDLKTKDKFVVSGSCSYLLKKEYSTLLTGRNITFEVLPLSFKEFLSFKNILIDTHNIEKGILLEKTRLQIITALKEYFSLGGFPEVSLKKEEYKLRVLEQYFDDILYKDIVDRYTLNSQKAKDLALFFMTNFTSLYSLRNLRNSLNLSYDTIKDYLSYYVEAYLFFVVDNFSYSFKEQKTLPSKIYCIDGGLRNAVSFKFSKDEGKLAENIVFVELKRRKNNPYYWKGKGEVDFVTKEKDQSLTAINVSFTDEIEPREIISLIEFKATFEKTKKSILLTKNIEKKEKGIQFIPLWKWLLID